MERDEFLKSLGLGLALVCTGGCLTGCGSKNKDVVINTPASGTKVTVDSTQLLSVGSSLSNNGVLIIRLAAGNTVSSFFATQVSCPHEGATLNWIQASNLIQCTLHSARFSSTGAVLAQPTGGGSVSALKTYAITISGTTLTATV
jgi:cytochrome b6-f complex iron-sulfur subunit